MNAAVNASPLIFLAKLDRLDLLFSEFDKVYTTSTVKDEVCLQPAKYPETNKILTAIREGKIKVINPTKTLNLQTKLDKGELSILSLAIEHKIDKLVLDDIKAIKTARSLDLTPVSTITILVNTCIKGRITKKECLEEIKRLTEFKYYVSIKLYTEIEKILSTEREQND